MKAQRSRHPGRAHLSFGLLTAGVVLVAINLRPAAASLGPVLDRIESATGLSSTWAGALTTLPVLCFGLLAPLAPVLAKRMGVRTAIAASMVALLAGLILRLLDGVGLLFAGTALAGAAIATGNVLVPVLVRRDLSERPGTAMALYSAGLVGFAALSAGVTVPLADALGGGWRPGLAVWAAPAAVAVLVWLPALLVRDDPASTGEQPEHSPHSASSLLRERLAWQVTLFFALQSAGFYAILAWLPSIFKSHGATDAHAGLLLSLSMVVGLPVAVVVPGLASRLRDQRPMVLACCVLIVAGLLGILLAPMSMPYLWVVLLGVGQQAAFPLALMLIVLRGGSVAATEGLSTLTQSVGYVLAALGPLAVGALHSATRSWTAPLILLLALIAPQAMAGLPAGRARQLAPPPRPEVGQLPGRNTEDGSDRPGPVALAGDSS